MPRASPHDPHEVTSDREDDPRGKLRAMFGARGLIGALLLSFVAVAGCGSSSPSSGTHEIAAKNYASNCASVADCFAVYEGPIGCCGGGCPNAAIRADALPKYTTDFDHAAPTCNPPPPCDPPSPCATGRIACVSGVCALEAPDAAATD
jgi:hypothetical protein